MHGRGACIGGGVCGGGHAWQGEGACMTGGICGIRSINGRYAPYWNAFLFKGVKGLSLKSKTPITGCAGKPYTENTISVPSLSYFIIQGYDSRGYLKVQVPFYKDNVLCKNTRTSPCHL